MDKIKNLKLRKMAFLTCLSATILTSCNSSSNTLEYQSISLTYDDNDNISSGSVAFNGLKDLKVVKFVDNETGIDTTRLILIEKITTVRPYSSHNHYIDVKSGATLYVKNNIYESEVEDDLKIVEERDIKPYLLQNDDIKQKYSIDEIIELCDEVIIPDIENNKELTK